MCGAVPNIRQIIFSLPFEVECVGIPYLYVEPLTLYTYTYTYVHPVTYTLTTVYHEVRSMRALDKSILETCESSDATGEGFRLVPSPTSYNQHVY